MVGDLQQQCSSQVLVDSWQTQQLQPEFGTSKTGCLCSFIWRDDRFLISSCFFGFPSHRWDDCRWDDWDVCLNHLQYPSRVSSLTPPPNPLSPPSAAHPVVVRYSASHIQRSRVRKWSGTKNIYILVCPLYYIFVRGPNPADVYIYIIIYIYTV